ncbi:hypothetical protein [Streptomyces anulatus]|uniref:hypothetical protein n=1 Tax=Streptomyces anulatus TaxID=1892 RepID=UPI00343801CF
MIAGENVTVAGNGTPGLPYVVSATGMDDCNCAVVAGDNVTVTGDGSPGSPYTVSTIGTPVVAGPGLLGNGTPGDPLVPSVSPWPYPCDIDTQGGRVYLDSSGVLRSEPRGRTATFVLFDNQAFPDVLVPAAVTLIVDEVLPITNPDPCRSALVITNMDIDVQIDMPANSGGASGIGTDSMTYLANRGNSLAENQHFQVSKERRFTVGAGASVNEPVQVSVSGGSGGARYNRAQWSIRAYMWIL